MRKLASVWFLSLPVCPACSGLRGPPWPIIQETTGRALAMGHGPRQTCKKSEISLDRHFNDWNFPKKARKLKCDILRQTLFYIVKITKQITIYFIVYILYISNYWFIGLKGRHFALFTFYGEITWKKGNSPIWGGQ